MIYNDVDQDCSLQTTIRAEILNDEGFITGFLLITNLEVEIDPPVSKEQINEQHTQASVYDYSPMTTTTITRNYRRADVDQVLSKPSEERLDARLEYVRHRQFEDESYQRIRYELSGLLQQPKYRKQRRGIEEWCISTSSSMPEKRQALKELLQPLFQQIITNDRKHSFDYRTYVIPNIRRHCYGKQVRSEQTGQGNFGETDEIGQECRNYPDNLEEPPAEDDLTDQSQIEELPPLRKIKKLAPKPTGMEEEEDVVEVEVVRQRFKKSKTPEPEEPEETEA